MKSLPEKSLPVFAVGDKVLVLYDDKLSCISMVERVTKTMVVTTNGERWNAVTGDEVGNRDQWHSTRIVPYDEQRVIRATVAMRAQRLRSKFSDPRTWREVPMDVCFDVAKLIGMDVSELETLGIPTSQSR